MRPTPLTLAIDTTLLKPGQRLGVGLSGGADSVALLRALKERSGELGLVLHGAHLHHGLRGEEAEADLEFSRALAAELDLPFHEARVDAAAEASAKGETLEEAARRLRYGWFRELMASGEVEAVATAHTRDDQAETVLAKFLRGAWTEGFSGIHPTVEFPEGRILRPLLATTRAEVEAYLNGLGQCWREDSSNRHLTFTRNRIRHELLPLLEGWNPRLREHLAQMAALARDEEAWWQAEVARLAPQFLLPGRPVRGGGRAAGNGLALDVTRLAALAPAVQRRLLRYAAMAAAERSAGPVPEYSGPIPGEISAPFFGLRLRIAASTPSPMAEGQATGPGLVATLRNWRPGDRVRLRYSSGPRKVKEVLERLRVTGSGRSLWPVLEVEGRIVWMKGVELEPERGFGVVATSLSGEGNGPAGESALKDAAKQG
ncbi:MAG: tRNA lysidine(34) synthetase TilS [Terracidiphilus sp.]